MELTIQNNTEKICKAFITSLVVVMGMLGNNTGYDKIESVGVNPYLTNSKKEFVNQELALQAFKRHSGAGYSTLNSKNYRHFYQKIKQKENQTEVDVRALKFFDIFENKDRNKAQSIYIVNRSINKTANRDLTKAIDYANKYSTSANPSFNYYAEDCTNYTSQLAYIAGKDLTNEWKPDSNTWINSDDLAKMTGIKAKYTKHSDFAEQIKAGDIVGIDYGNDGDCDHTGFVTKTSNKIVKDRLTDRVYKDYKIAQHTKSYHKWTSSEENEWEKAELLGYVYWILND